MTAPTSDALASALPAWHVADDGVGEETLWHGDTAVLRRCDIGVGAVSLATREYRDWLFDVLTRVLAPDEATVEEISAEVGEHDLITSTQPWTCSCGGWSLVIGAGSHAMHFVRAHITALAALGRHVGARRDTTGGDEDG